MPESNGNVQTDAAGERPTIAEAETLDQLLDQVTHAEARRHLVRARDIIVREQMEGRSVTAQQPPRSANKPAWVDYAVSEGADRDEAEATTKEALIERYAED